MTLPDTMFGIQLTGHGGPEVLHARHDIPVPKPGPGEVLIRVAAAGVNNTDINTRLAWYSKGDADGEDASWSGKPLQFPRIQGADVCGRIAAVGDGVSPERIGERVLIEPCLREHRGEPLDPPWYFGSECDGGFAQYTTVAARHACRIDSALSDVELASFPCSYSTAENLLTRAEVAAGERVLVTAPPAGSARPPSSWPRPAGRMSSPSPAPTRPRCCVNGAPTRSCAARTSSTRSSTPTASMWWWTSSPASSGRSTWRCYAATAATPSRAPSPARSSSWMSARSTSRTCACWAARCWSPWSSPT